MNKKIYSTYDISRLLSVDITTVQNWIKEGKLGAYKTPGGHRRIPEKNFKDFVKKYNVPLYEEEAVFNVLIADDEKKIRESLKKALERKYKKIRVFEAGDGFGAGMLMVKEKISLLVLDIMMPGLDGFEVMEQVKKNPGLGSPEIIVITGYLEDGLEEKVFSMGASSLLIKPFEISEFREAVEQAAKKIR